MSIQQFSIKKWVYRHQLYLLLLFFLFGCSSEDKDIEKYIQSVHERPEKPLAIGSVLSDRAAVSRLSIPEGNPFHRVNPVFSENDHLLKKVDINAVQWVGILRKKNIVWGLISLPNGIVIPVQSGAMIDKGRVLSVGEDGIEVEISGEIKLIRFPGTRM